MRIPVFIEQKKSHRTKKGRCEKIIDTAHSVFQQVVAVFFQHAGRIAAEADVHIAVMRLDQRDQGRGAIDIL